MSLGQVLGGRGYFELTHPDGFPSHWPKRHVDPAIPVASDPGGWTVVIHHVKSGPGDDESIGCAGFRVGSS